MPDANELHVRPGDDVFEAFERYRAWAAATEPRFNGRMHSVRRIPNGGTVATFIGGRSWPSPFLVSTSGETVAIAPGSVNGATPTIGGVPLNGLLPDGSEVDRPALKLREIGGGEGFVSFVGVRVLVDLASGLVRDDADDWLTIEERAELPQGFGSGGFPDAGDGIGFQPLARLYWTREGAFRRSEQIVYHNLTHLYVKSRDKARNGRHFFAGV